MSLAAEVDEIAHTRHALAAQLGGGEEKVARHKAAGKLTVRRAASASITDKGLLRRSGLAHRLRPVRQRRAAGGVHTLNLVMGRALSGTARGGAATTSPCAAAPTTAPWAKLIFAEKMAHDLRACHGPPRGRHGRQRLGAQHRDQRDTPACRP